MYSIGSFLGTFVVQLPVLAVLVIGLVLLSAGGRRLTGRAGTLARAGLIVLLAECVGALVWSIVLPQLISRAAWGNGLVRSFGIASAAVGLLLSILTAAGLGLLVAALLATRDPAPPPGTWGAPPGGQPPPPAGFPQTGYPQSGYPPASYPQGGQPSPGGTHPPGDQHPPDGQYRP